MAKKKTSTPVQKLSPENYIRRKARTLPVLECLINKGWDEGKMTNVIVARQHSNGNITAGIYLVDLLCLGVKDTTWFFNMPMHEYRERLEELINANEDVLETIDYALAHNIIYAGVAFAEEFEFKPHKEFTSVTQYILNEDTEDIPLIEIECGIDGLPAYMQGPLHNDAKARQVIAQLEQMAGPGNYYLLNEDGAIAGYEDSLNEIDEEDPFSHLLPEEKKTEFENRVRKLGTMNQDDTVIFFNLTRSIIFDVSYNTEYDNYFEAFNRVLSSMAIVETEIPDALLGATPGSDPLPNKIKLQFLGMLTNTESKKLKKQLHKFRKNKGVEAACGYLDLIITEMDNPENYNAGLNAAVQKFPHYALLQMRLAETKIEKFEDFEKYNYNYFFNGRNAIHPFEFFNLAHVITLCILVDNDLNKSEAWKNTLIYHSKNREDLVVLHGKIFIYQIKQIAHRFNINLDKLAQN